MNLGGSDGVASLSIIWYAQGLFGSLFRGYVNGISSVVSYNLGRSDKGRLSRLFRISVWILLVASAAVTVISYLLGGTVVNFFAKGNKHVATISLHGFRIVATSFIMMAVNVFASGWFTALNDGTLLLLLMLLLQMASSSSAETLTKLGNSALRKAIKDSVYADWHIYQPTDMEISEKNVFNTFLFKKGSSFPLVAEKNGVYCLLVMKKQKSGWVVGDAYSDLLFKEGYLVTRFAIDSGFFDAEYTTGDMRIWLRNNDGIECSILVDWDCMNGESTVRGIFVNDPNYPIIDCTTNMFVGTYQNGAYIFEYQNAQLSDFVSYRIDSDSAYNDFSRFQLSCVPFYPNDVMETSVLHDLLGVVNRPAVLFLDLEKSIVLCDIPPEAEIRYASCTDDRAYVIEYNSHLGYVFQSE